MNKCLVPNMLRLSAAFIACLCLPHVLFGWGAPHHYISQAALDCLPAAQREGIESQVSPFVGRYCLYPDVAGAEDAAPYIMPKAGLRLHIMDSREKNEEVFEFYVPRVLKAFQGKQIEEGMRWFGALAHYLEDSSCPGHIPFGNAEIPKGAMPLTHLEFFERFMPVPKRLEEGNFHSRVDAGGFTLTELRAAMEGYQPVLLGTSAAEVVLNLGERQYRMNQECVKHLIPMMMALCQDQKKEFAKGFGTGVLTDYTFLVPPGVFTTFSVDVGSNADIGSEGIAGFSILLDGKSMAETGDMQGDEPAKHLEVELGEARKLTLKTTGQGKSAKIHAVWANPILKK